MMRAGSLLAALLMLNGCQPMTAPLTPAPVAATAVTEGVDAMALPEPLRGVRHIGITVSDIDATLQFYGRAVGFQLVSRYRVPASRFPAGTHSSQGTVEIALVRTPTVFLQLMDFDPDHGAAPYSLPVQGPGYTHICIQSPSTNSGYDRFRAAGMAMITPGDGPVDVGGYGVTYAYGRDTDGTMYEMEQVDRPRRSDAEWPSHYAVVTPDIERMLGFYQRLVGYAPHRRVTTSNPRLMRIGNFERATIHGGWIALRNLEVEVWQYVDPVTPQPAGPRMLETLGHSLVAFEVSDLAAQINRMRQNGIRLVGRPVMMVGWRIQYARDPDGNLIAVQQNIAAGADESIESMRWIDPAASRVPPPAPRQP